MSGLPGGRGETYAEGMNETPTPSSGPSPAQRRRIVSSRHLADGDGWEASEFEFGLIVAGNAFTRWTLKCMAAAGAPDLGPLDILVLHNVNHRERDKRLVDIAFLLGIEDAHTVNYALKKLSKAKLIEAEKRGKEMFYRTSPEGADLCRRYRDVRRQCLLEMMGHSDLKGEELQSIAAALRAMSGIYDQAARAAASL